MALKSKTIRGQFANATAVLLAASSTLTRYVRSIKIINDTGTQQTWNYAHAATATSAGPGYFGKTLAPNDVFNDACYGKGSRLDNVAISGFASSATSVTYEINYDESDTLDA
jgi:hypothetical protein